MRLVFCVVLITGALTSTAQGIGADGRRGPVGLDGRALTDADGPFNALGASLFWALWGERHDPDRLDANLAWLAEHGVDFVRILGMVGTHSWSDRRIDPRAGDYWEVVDRLLARLARHGLRAAITIFADAQVMMPDASERRRFAEDWTQRVGREPERFVFIEVTNEYWQNGFDDVAELRDIGRQVAERTRVLVALSAAGRTDACEVYAGSAADLATVHYPRNLAGRWSFVIQPWRWPSDYEAQCPGMLPVAVNNEPAGPGASEYGGDDPRRLVMAYVVSFLSQNAAYVLHTGAGVRGGGAADLALGRRANVFDVPGLDVALAGMRATRSYLPGGVANWSRQPPEAATHPFEGLETALQQRMLDGVVTVTSAGHFIVALVGARAPVLARTRRACTIELRDILTGGVQQQLEFGAGEAFSLEEADAFVLTGRCQ